MTTAPLRILLTGFEPFGGEPVNPSQQLVEDLASESTGELILNVAVLPVDIRTVTKALDDAIALAQPHAIVLLGQAAGRGEICLETTAFNQVSYGDSVDNGGTQVKDAPVDPRGPERLDSTLPVEKLERLLAEAGHPVRQSDDAGRYLCNHVLYTTLRRYPQVLCTFVHVPLLPEQAERRALAEPSLSRETLREALRALLSHLPRHVPGRSHESLAPRDADS